MFHAWAFDDVMAFEYLNFFLVSQVLSFRHKKQNSKNVADTTFKDTHNATV